MIIQILTYSLSQLANKSKFFGTIFKLGRNVNSSFSIVTMRRVAIIFFQLRVVKHFEHKFKLQATL